MIVRMGLMSTPTDWVTEPGISATMIFNVPKVRRLIEDVRQTFGARAPQIVLGGAAFLSAPALGIELGTAGAATDLRTARVLVNDLSTGTDRTGSCDSWSPGV